MGLGGRLLFGILESSTGTVATDSSSRCLSTISSLCNFQRLWPCPSLYGWITSNIWYKGCEGSVPCFSWWPDTLRRYRKLEGRIAAIVGGVSGGNEGARQMIQCASEVMQSVSEHQSEFAWDDRHIRDVIDDLTRLRIILSPDGTGVGLSETINGDLQIVDMPLWPSRILLKPAGSRRPFRHHRLVALSVFRYAFCHAFTAAL